MTFFLVGSRKSGRNVSVATWSKSDIKNERLSISGHDHARQHFPTISLITDPRMAVLRHRCFYGNTIAVWVFLAASIAGHIDRVIWLDAIAIADGKDRNQMALYGCWMRSNFSRGDWVRFVGSIGLGAMVGASNAKLYLAGSIGSDIYPCFGAAHLRYNDIDEANCARSHSLNSLGLADQ